ncbi:MAG: hypothetical protein RL596_1021 [Bacteroidota bacterium]
MHSNCLNCNNPLQPNQSFCASCGQKTNTHRFNMQHFGHELVHAFTHADKGVFHLIKELTLHPGKVLREYITEGKRKKYFNPFTLLLIVAGISVIVNIYFKPYSGKLKSEAATEKEMIAQKATPQKIELAKKSIRINNFIEKNIKLILFASIPFSAFVFFIFYRKSGYNYAEHLVANLFLTAFFNLVMTLLIPLQVMINKFSTFLLYTIPLLLFQLIYFAVAYQGL